MLSFSSFFLFYLFFVVRLNGEYWKFLTSRKTSQLCNEIEGLKRESTSDNGQREGLSLDLDASEIEDEENRREEEIATDARGLVFELLRTASSYPSRSTFALSKVSTLLSKYHPLTKWLICLEANGTLSFSLIFFFIFIFVINIWLFKTRFCPHWFSRQD